MSHHSLEAVIPIAELSLNDGQQVALDSSHEMMAKKKKKHKKAVAPPEPSVLPELFSDDIMVAALSGEPHFYSHSLPLTCGLMQKVRASFQRAYRRSECRFARRPLDEHAQQFFEVLRSFLSNESELVDVACWSSFDWQPTAPTVVVHERLMSVAALPRVQMSSSSPLTANIEYSQSSPFDRLYSVAEELTLKCINLSIPLQKEFSQQPLRPLHPVTAQLQFSSHFLDEIAAYHDTVRRPTGTFVSKTSESESALLSQLLALPREVCQSCLGRRQIYCGPCQGLRMHDANVLLPPPVQLPFDLLLLLHHQESLVKCTGIHTKVLSVPEETSVIDWPKERAAIEEIVVSLDPERDVLLFPYAHSLAADEFPWTQRLVSDSMRGEATNSSLGHRWRLVVLEASWNYAKGMSALLVEIRKKRGLPPLRSVILNDVTGEYWRFQAEGHSAVSTIEAIAHTAKAAGLSEQDKRTLLLLFELQKFRVLHNNETMGAKAPRAVAVEGAGLGSWKLVDPI